MATLGFCLLPCYIFPSFTTTGENPVAALLRFSFKKKFLGGGILQGARKEIPSRESQRETPCPAKRTGMPCAKEQGGLILMAGVLGFWAATHPTKSRDSVPMVTLADLTPCWQIFRGIREAKRFHLLLGSSVSPGKSTRPG